MKTTVVIFAVFLAVALQSEQEKSPPIGLDQIHNRGVAGRLGVRLGNVIDIKATIVSGRETRRKALSSLYLLDVTEINDKQLAAPIRLRFSVPPIADAKLASTNFGLYKLKHGEPAKRLSSAQLDELEKDYVGSEVKLAVYETGGYSGIPNNLPADFPAWQGQEFHFSTHLIVLEQVE